MATAILSPSIRSHGQERHVQTPNLHTQHTLLYWTAMGALYWVGVVERWRVGRRRGEREEREEYITSMFTTLNVLPSHNTWVNSRCWQTCEWTSICIDIHICLVHHTTHKDMYLLHGEVILWTFFSDRVVHTITMGVAWQIDHLQSRRRDGGHTWRRWQHRPQHCLYLSDKLSPVNHYYQLQESPTNLSL